MNSERDSFEESTTLSIAQQKNLGLSSPDRNNLLKEAQIVPRFADVHLMICKFSGVSASALTGVKAFTIREKV